MDCISVIWLAVLAVPVVLLALVGLWLLVNLLNGGAVWK
jgi:hypothetical protein